MVQKRPEKIKRLFINKILKQFFMIIIMSFKVFKTNGELKFIDYGGYETRNPSTMWCIQEANKIYNWDNFNEIIIYTQDYESNKDNFTYSKQNSYKNLVPDFNFHSWPEVGIYDYDMLIKEIDIAGLNLFEINKVGWIGNKNTNFRRHILMQIANENKELFDCFDMEWINVGKKTLNSTKYISIPDLVKKYSILIDIEGNGYSGRLKFLLWSHRPLLLVDRPHKEFFFEHLKEWEHYIPVKRDLTDLIEKTKWCLDNYDKALSIAENAYNFSKQYLTRYACFKKWDEIITGMPN
jgi:hypothetical protein